MHLTGVCSYTLARYTIKRACLYWVTASFWNPFRLKLAKSLCFSVRAALSDKSLAGISPQSFFFLCSSFSPFSLFFPFMSFSCCAPFLSLCQSQWISGHTTYTVVFSLPDKLSSTRLHNTNPKDLKRTGSTSQCKPALSLSLVTKEFPQWDWCLLQDKAMLDQRANPNSINMHAVEKKGKLLMDPDIGFVNWQTNLFFIRFWFSR